MRAIVKIDKIEYDVKYDTVSGCHGFYSRDDFYNIYASGEYPIEKTLSRAYDAACDNENYNAELGETVEFTNKSGKTVIATVFPN